ncbi:protein GUCD1-like [Dendronephthya gigantea]|uniref:protein GUCD1-like n=1 Tax=Dendronephthya gigantea TaxID=151771 RepID=UPI00106D87B5|nr:protein GUCD1-like [Dendronephthya gigantea]
MATKKIDLPHVLQKHEWDCGLACIQMILLKLQQISDDSALFSILPTLGIGESIWTIDLANILRHFNINCVYYTITCGVDPGYRAESFYKSDFDAEQVRVNTLFAKAEEMGIKVIKKSITLDEIISKLKNGFIAIILVDSNMLKCNVCNYPWNTSDDTSSEYEGHFLVLCGYDPNTEVIFCKNPSSYDDECCMDILSIDQARKSYGTDEDVIFIDMNQATATFIS